MSNDLVQLAREAGDGSLEAKRALLRAVAPLILSTARRIVAVDAEDVAQEALLDFSRDVDSLRAPEAVKAFAVRLTTRLAIRVRHKRRREASKRSQFAVELAVDGRRSANPVAARQTVEELLSHLDVLPEEQSETLLLRYFMGLSLEEVAQAHGVSINTVRSRVRLARHTLGRHLHELRKERNDD